MEEHNTNVHTLEDKLAEAKALHQSGKTDEANSIYVQILDACPQHTEAMRLRAVVYLDKGYAELSKNLLLEILSLDPNNASVHNNLGSVYQSLKQPQQAISCYQKALTLQPDFFPAANNLANTLRTLGETNKAIRIYRDALRLNRKKPELWNNLGNALLSANDVDGARQCLLEALSLNPEYKDAWNNLGTLYTTCREVDSALQAYDKALALGNKDSLTLNNKGNLLLKLKYFDRAAECFEQSLLVNAELTEAWNGLGCAYRGMGELSKSEEQLRRATQLRPDYAEAWNNLGLTLADMGRLDDAIEAFHTTLELSPKDDRTHSNLLLHYLYHPDISETTLLEAHEAWAAAHQRYTSPEVTASETEIHPIRVGFVSADLGRHPVGYFLLPLLENLSADRFQVYCYSNSPREDDVSHLIKQYCKRWIFCAGMPDQVLARQIRQDGVDILFDLSGHTAGNRLRVFSLRPAPIQISWLGYPGTTGMDCMDYVLRDDLSLPEFMHWQFTEKVASLPGGSFCYAAPDYTPEVGAPPMQKNGFITFGCFNNPVKFNNKTFGLWADILLKCPDSRLVLSWKSLHDPGVSRLILDAFEKLGIDTRRIQLLGGRRQHHQVFKDYNLIDIALDTMPFSGALTSCEALWMGVPVVTRAGKRPASRQSAALLGALDLDELVAFSMQEYLDCAVRLAADAPRLSALRQDLRQRLMLSSVGDRQAFCRKFEALMLSLYKKELIPHRMN